MALRPSFEEPGWDCKECGKRARWDREHVCVFRWRYVDATRGTFYVEARNRQEAIDRLVAHLKAISISGVELCPFGSEPVSIVDGRIAPCG